VLPVSSLRSLASFRLSLRDVEQRPRVLGDNEQQRARAAPDGARGPCSQSCNVRTDTPSNDANHDWEGPVFSRIIATSGTLGAGRPVVAGSETFGW